MFNHVNYQLHKTKDVMPNTILDPFHPSIGTTFNSYCLYNSQMLPNVQI